MDRLLSIYSPADRHLVCVLLLATVNNFTDFWLYLSLIHGFCVPVLLWASVWHPTTSPNRTEISFLTRHTVPLVPWPFSQKIRFEKPVRRGWASLVAQLVKNPPAMRETWVWSLGWEDPLEEGIATHSSILAWRIPMDRGAWQAIVHGVARIAHTLVTKPPAPRF